MARLRRPLHASARHLLRRPLAEEGGGALVSKDFTQGGTPTNFTRASNANYWNSSAVRTVAASNVPRIDYDPLTGRIRGLLLEEQKTNFLLNSLTPATQSVSLALGTYTVWMEGSGTVTTAAGTAVGTGFGVASGGAIGTFGTINTFTLTTAGTVSFTVAGTVTAFQCEGGTFATSMITTTGAAGTRAADSGFDVFSSFNTDESTIEVEYMPEQNLVTGAIVALNNNSTSNYYAVFHRNTGTQESYVSREANVNNVVLTQTPLVANFVAHRLASRNKASDFAFSSLANALTKNIVNTTMTSGITHLYYGTRRTDQYMNGWVRKVTVYGFAKTDAALLAYTLPANIAAPVIVSTGSGYAGDVITVYKGLWNGDNLMSYTYQWYADGVAISGETGTTYTVTFTTEGKAITCVETATGAPAGVMAATSNIIQPFFYTSVSGLSFWEVNDPATITKDGSDLVAQVSDKSGRGNHWIQATGTAKPTWTASALGTQPALNFDGTTDSLSTTNTLSINGEETFIVVVKVPSYASGYNALLGNTASNNVLAGSEQNTARPRWTIVGSTDGVGSLRGPNVAPRTYQAAQWVTLRLRRSVIGNYIEVCENGARIYGTTHTSGGTLSGTLIIGRDGNNNRLAGQIAMAAHATRALSDSEVEAVEKLMVDKCKHYAYSSTIRAKDPGVQRYFHRNGYTSPSQLPAEKSLATGDGQSNMGGRAPNGSLPAGLIGPIANAYIWSETNQQFEILEAGVNNLPDAALCFGPEMAFMKCVTTDFGQYFYFKYATGGTAMGNRWLVGGDLCEGFVSRLANARYVHGYNTGVQLNLTVNQFAQGEADAQNTAYAAAYLTNLRGMVAYWRSVVPGMAAAKWGLNICKDTTIPVRAGLQPVIDAEATVIAENSSFMSSLGQWSVGIGDTVHAGAPDQISFGNQMALIAGATTQV